MFNSFLGAVTAPQFVIDSVDLALCFGEFNEFTSKALESAMEDIFLFQADMIMGVISPL